MATQIANSTVSRTENQTLPLVLAAALVTWICLFALASNAWGASTSGSTGLVLMVPEAATLNVSSDLVTVRIRLASGVAAQVWTDRTCSTPSSEAVAITRSGVHTIALTQFAPAGDGARFVCLASSDGRLNAASSLPAGMRLPDGATYQPGL